MTDQMREINTVHARLLNEMERSLALLAGRWRSRQQTAEEEGIIRQYQAILRCMIELGYRESLDVDSELPDEWMPAEYFALFK